MTPQHKKLLRIANLIRGHVAAQPNRMLAALAADERWASQSLQHYLGLCRKANKAACKGWFAAAKQMAAAAENALEDLRYEINSRPRPRQQEDPAPASLSDVIHDLDQLETEFGEWQFDEAGQNLCAQTETIELEDVELGAFDIKLHLPSLGKTDPSTAYSIIAQDPNASSARSDVTHPHVSDERLCAGDAAVPIRCALESGRICDFFLLVRSVLTTYNSHSAYVPLSRWGGSPCHDCGYLMGEDEGSTCESCSESFCDSCCSYCRHCDSSVCTSCLETCPHCDDRFCSECMSTCSDCGTACCVGCLNEGLCPTCQKTKETDHELHQQPAGSENAAVAVQTTAA